MSELEGLILYWETVLSQSSHLLEPSVLAHIQNTIKYLKLLPDKER